MSASFRSSSEADTGHGAGSYTSLTISTPLGATDDDLLIALVGGTDNGTGRFVSSYPADWIEEGSGNAPTFPSGHDDMFGSQLSRYPAAGLGGSHTFNFSGAVEYAWGVILAYIVTPDVFVWETFCQQEEASQFYTNRLRATVPDPAQTGDPVLTNPIVGWFWHWPHDTQNPRVYVPPLADASLTVPGGVTVLHTIYLNRGGPPYNSSGDAEPYVLVKVGVVGSPGDYDATVGPEYDPPASDHSPEKIGIGLALSGTEEILAGWGTVEAAT